MRVVSGLGPAGFVALSLLAVPARAQNPAAAEALFEEARAAMAAGSYDVACARFRDSDKLDPAVGTRFNLADCEERRGRVATAWSTFRGVASELGPEDDRKPIAEERARALEPRLPYLTLRRTSMTPRGVRVRIDGVELGEASIGVALPMDPGTHELALLPAAGGEEQRASFTLREGQHASLPVRILVKSEPSPSRPPSPPADAPQSSLGTRRTWALVAGGIGVAGGTPRPIKGGITLDKKSTAHRNCDDGSQLCNQTGADANRSGRAFAIASSVGFGVGVVGLAAAAYLWLTESPTSARGAYSSIPARGSRRRVALTPQLAWERDKGFVALSGSF